MLLAGVLVAGAMLAIPGAVRAHHHLNVMPFPHLLVAGAATWLWRSAGAAGIATRAAVALALTAVVASQVHVTRETQRLLHETGGRGRFSESIREAAARLESDPEARGISLDWGLHEPLLFLTRRARLVEPVWQIRRTARQRGRWSFEASARDVYLVHPPDYDLFGFGAPFLRAVRRLEREHPDLPEIREHRDAQGELAFLSVRVGADHTLQFDRGFRIGLGDRSAP